MSDSILDTKKDPAARTMMRQVTEIAPVFVNRVTVSSYRSTLRITFGEQTDPNIEPKYRTSVVMDYNDALIMIDMLMKTINHLQTKEQNLKKTQP